MHLDLDTRDGRHGDQLPVARPLDRRDRFDVWASFLRTDLEPLLAERERLSGGAIDGPCKALSGVDVARQWDEAEDTTQRRAMLVDAVGADHVRVLSTIPGTRVHVFNPDRIVLVPADAPFTPQPT